ncbi:hypothetical protein VH22019_00058 [Vibrio phage VH2_2019]|nr:hypothetical protein VH22019_00058 [Vibrio phage VH2_2019]
MADKPKGKRPPQPKTKVLTSARIRQIEAELQHIDQKRKEFKNQEKDLKDELKDILRENDISRTLHFRVSLKRSGGTLDAQALSRHFGCSPSFLSKFRRYTKSSLYLEKAKEPVNPELIELEESSVCGGKTTDSE